MTMRHPLCRKYARYAVTVVALIFVYWLGAIQGAVQGFERGKRAGIEAVLSELERKR